MTGATYGGDYRSPASAERTAAIPLATIPSVPLTRVATTLLWLYFISSLSFVCSFWEGGRNSGLLARLEKSAQYALWRLEHGDSSS